MLQYTAMNPKKEIAVKNYIQLRPGLSLSQFNDQYGTEEQCQNVLEKIRWPSKIP
jgi:hypothetical protein